MTKAKKILLLHERRETWRVRFDKNRRAFCRRCAAETVWLTGAQAARLSGLTEREIFRLADSGKTHFAETGSGLLLICETSLKTFCDGNDQTGGGKPAV